MTTEHDNMRVVHVPIRLEVDLKSHGYSHPDVVLYNKTIPPPETKRHEQDIGPEVIHRYDVWNRGRTPISKAEVVILWPSFTISGQNLLYLLEQPQTSRMAQCEFVANVNPLNVTVVKSVVPVSKSYSSAVVGLAEYSDLESSSDDNEFNNTSTHQVFSNESLHNQRTKRNGHQQDFDRELSCGSTLCSQIHCTAFSLGRGDHVYFQIRSRLWTNTLRSLGFDELKITSKLVTRIAALPYTVQPYMLGYSVYVVNTVVSPADSGHVRRQVPWWIIAAAVCAGILLLSIVVIILWKVGFFKRKRPRDEVERLPLNKPERNGKLINGDELL